MIFILVFIFCLCSTAEFCFPYLFIYLFLSCVSSALYIYMYQTSAFLVYIQIVLLDHCCEILHFLFGPLVSFYLLINCCKSSTNTYWVSIWLFGQPCLYCLSPCWSATVLPLLFVILYVLDLSSCFIIIIIIVIIFCSF